MALEILVRSNGMEVEHSLQFHHDDDSARTTFSLALPHVDHRLCDLYLGGMDSRQFWNAGQLSVVDHVG